MKEQIRTPDDLTDKHILAMRIHLARSVATALVYSRSPLFSEDVSSLWESAAFKLTNIEPWMSACCGYKLFGIGDGGSSIQPSHDKTRSHMDYVDFIFSHENETGIDLENDREMLVDTCIRLAIGGTTPEAELIVNMSEHGEKWEHAYEKPSPDGYI